MRDMEETVRLFKAIADTQRLRILKLLEAGPLCVCEIASILGLSPSTVSSHLSILKEVGLVFDHKEHRWVNCYLNRASRDPRIRAMLDFLSTQCNENPVILGDRKKIKSRMTRSLVERTQ